MGNAITVFPLFKSRHPRDFNANHTPQGNLAILNKKTCHGVKGGEEGGGGGGSGGFLGGHAQTARERHIYPVRVLPEY